EMVGGEALPTVSTRRDSPPKGTRVADDEARAFVLRGRRRVSVAPPDRPRERGIRVVGVHRAERVRHRKLLVEAPPALAPADERPPERACECLAVPLRPRPDEVEDVPELVQEREPDHQPAALVVGLRVLP